MEWKMLPIQGCSQLVRRKGARSEMMEDTDGVEWDAAGLFTFLNFILWGSQHK